MSTAVAPDRRRAARPPAAGRDLLPLAVGGVVFAVLSLLATPLPVGVGQDDGIYVILAKALATGRGYRYIHIPGAPAAAHYPPGFPLLLSLLWRLSPSFPANVALFQLVNNALLGAAAAAMYLLARRVLRDRAAAAATTLGGFLMLPMVAVSMTLMSEPLWLALAIPWLLAAERLAAGAEARPGDASTIWPVLGLGVAGGAIALVRTQSVVLIAGALVMLAVRRRWRAVALLALGALVPLLPWQLWVARHAHEVPQAIEGKYGSYGAWLATGLRAEGPALLGRALLHNSALAWEMVCQAFAVPGLPTLLMTPLIAVVAVAGARLLWRRAPVTLLALVLNAFLIVAWPFDPRRFVWGSWCFVVGWLAAGAVELWGLTRKSAVPHRAVALGVALCVAGAVAESWRGYARGAHRHMAVVTARRIIPAVEWVTRNAAPDDVVASDDETAIYLYTGRLAVPVSSFVAAGYAGVPEAVPLPSALPFVVSRYSPDVVIAYWHSSKVAARALTRAPSPSLVAIGDFGDGEAFRRVP